ncbi:hypothetical protein Q3G72_026766 [Acer saccharum]|nr:hypothetical protein Q3G72_026766 [Acer saccharum]
MAVFSVSLKTTGQRGRQITSKMRCLLHPSSLEVDLSPSMENDPVFRRRTLVLVSGFQHLKATSNSFSSNFGFHRASAFLSLRLRNNNSTKFEDEGPRRRDEGSI